MTSQPRDKTRDSTKHDTAKFGIDLYWFRGGFIAVKRKYKHDIHSNSNFQVNGHFEVHGCFRLYKCNNWWFNQFLVMYIHKINPKSDFVFRFYNQNTTKIWLLQLGHMLLQIASYIK